MTELRHTTFTGDPQVDAVLSAENARDANAALETCVKGRLLTTEFVTTDSVAVEYLRLPAESRPTAVILVNIYQKYDPGERVTFSSSSFLWDDKAKQVLYPFVLTAGVVFVVTFLIL